MSMKKGVPSFVPARRDKKGNKEREKETAEFAAASHLRRKESDTKWGWEKKGPSLPD